jgi:hypothetical protein
MYLDGRRPLLKGEENLDLGRTSVSAGVDGSNPRVVLSNAQVACVETQAWSQGWKRDPGRGRPKGPHEPDRPGQ